MKTPSHQNSEGYSLPFGINAEPGHEKYPKYPKQPAALYSFEIVRLWSTYRFVPSNTKHGSGIVSTRFFVAQLGAYGQGYGHGRTLTLTETNMKESGRFPVPVSLLGAHWEVWGCKKDREMFIETGVWSFDMIQTIAGIAPFSTRTTVHPAEAGVYRGSVGLEGKDGGSLFRLNDRAVFGVRLDHKEHQFTDECFVRFTFIGKTNEPIEIS